MRTLRYFFAVSVLSSALSLSTFAGDIHTGIAPQPEPTPTAQGDIQNGVAGDMHTGSSEEATTGDSVVAGVLGLVQSVLSLL